jgi:murein L,D-transpeptidase YcbB/YkuD
MWASAASPVVGQQSDLRLDLNLPALRLTVYEGDRAIRSYPVAIGMRGHDTPTGAFDIDFAEWNPWWHPPARAWARDEKVTPPGPGNPMGRVKLFFEPLYFIHGTPERGSIGTPASHGCIRMLNSDVIALARLIHERAAPAIAPQIDGILRSGRTRRVDLRRSVPFTIRYDPVVVEDGKLVVYPDVYRRNAVHAEGVYQALVRAGYEVGAIPFHEVRGLVERARGRRDVYTIRLDEAFGRIAAVTEPLEEPVDEPVEASR